MAFMLRETSTGHYSRQKFTNKLFAFTNRLVLFKFSAVGRAKNIVQIIMNESKIKRKTANEQKN